MSNEITPDQIQLLMQLEGIFMPRARRQRDEVYEKQSKDAAAKEPVRFVHYTTRRQR
jgi:hypothetical protein